MIMQNERQNILCKLVTGAHIDSNEFDIIKRTEFYEFACENDVAAIAGHHLATTDGFSLWTRAHDTNVKRLSAYLVELDGIAAELDKRNIKVVALKNGGIARGIFSCPGCCPMGDIDLLVKKDDLLGAHEIMLARGYTFKFRSELEKENIATALKSGGTEYYKKLDDTTIIWIEIQWRPIAGRWLRQELEPKVEELFERSLEIPGTKVRLLQPNDNLLQVALHTAKHTYVRAPGFRLHLDVHRIATLQNVEWDAFCTTVRSKHLKTAVYLSLLLPKLLFRTPIPEHVLEKLSPSKWKKKLFLSWITRAGLFNPDEKKFGRVEFILFNVLLFDSIQELIKTVFVSKTEIQEQYESRSLLYGYLKRLSGLLFRKLKL